MKSVADRRVGDALRTAKRLQSLKHNVNIHESSPRMTESARQRSDDFHSEIFPKFDRRFVGRDHKIELQCAKTESTRFIQAMFAHCAAGPLPASPLCDDECCVRDVRTAAGLIRMQCIAADNLTVLFGDKNMRATLKPISERRFPRDVRIQGIGIAGCDHCPKNVPDRVAV